MFMNPSFLFDMMCTAVWLGLAVHYARKGLLAALVQIVGSLFSLIGAQQAAAWGSGALFDRFLAGSFRERIAVSLSAGGAVDLAAIAERYAGFLPEPIRRQVVAACEQALAGLLTDNVLVMADTIVQEVIRPLLTPVFSVVLFFLCFAALRMVISLLVTVLGLVNRLPVLGAVNRGLGLAAGVAAGLADVFLLLCVVWALIVITGGNLPALNEQLLGGSIYYQTFSRINPFL
ncbi:MAG TPA: hypothetical protein H9771_04555 [Candidatus Faecalibacterium faecipullorum]|uniref:CvpA family protein n=1 Tax=Candidatus Faecalibacterium faecipullorum TaxID=2838578 RepID=A0A9D2S6L2_9FIRM|nr:hypothetical protein [Candidatus Faecalibacterium faecipullorum]